MKSQDGYYFVKLREIFNPEIGQIDNIIEQVYLGRNLLHTDISDDMFEVCTRDEKYICVDVPKELWGHGILWSSKVRILRSLS